MGEFPYWGGEGLFSGMEADGIAFAVGEDCHKTKVANRGFGLQYLAAGCFHPGNFAEAIFGVKINQGIAAIGRPIGLFNQGTGDVAGLFIKRESGLFAPFWREVRELELKYGFVEFFGAFQVGNVDVKPSNRI